MCELTGGYNTDACSWDGGDCCESTCDSDNYDCGVHADYQCLDADADDAQSCFVQSRSLSVSVTLIWMCFFMDWISVGVVRALANHVVVYGFLLLSSANPHRGLRILWLCRVIQGCHTIVHGGRLSANFLDSSVTELWLRVRGNATTSNVVDGTALAIIESFEKQYIPSSISTGGGNAVLVTVCHVIIGIVANSPTVHVTLTLCHRVVVLFFVEMSLLQVFIVVGVSAVSVLMVFVDEERRRLLSMQLLLSLVLTPLLGWLIYHVAESIPQHVLDRILPVVVVCLIVVILWRQESIDALLRGRQHSAAAGPIPAPFKRHLLQLLRIWMMPCSVLAVKAIVDRDLVTALLSGSTALVWLYDEVFGTNHVIKLHRTSLILQGIRPLVLILSGTTCERSCSAEIVSLLLAKMVFRTASAGALTDSIAQHIASVLWLMMCYWIAGASALPNASFLLAVSTYLSIHLFWASDIDLRFLVAQNTASPPPSPIDSAVDDESAATSDESSDSTDDEDAEPPQRFAVVSTLCEGEGRDIRDTILQMAYEASQWVARNHTLVNSMIDNANTARATNDIVSEAMDIIDGLNASTAESVDLIGGYPSTQEALRVRRDDILLASIADSSNSGSETGAAGERSGGASVDSAVAAGTVAHTSHRQSLHAQRDTELRRRRKRDASAVRQHGDSCEVESKQRCLLQQRRRRR